VFFSAKKNKITYFAKEKYFILFYFIILKGKNGTPSLT